MIIENIQTLNTVLHPPGNIRNTKHRDNRYTQTTQHNTERRQTTKKETDRDNKSQRIKRMNQNDNRKHTNLKYCASSTW